MAVAILIAIGMWNQVLACAKIIRGGQKYHRQNSAKGKHKPEEDTA
jgi:hypothetical protein